MRIRSSRGDVFAFFGEREITVDRRRARLRQERGERRFSILFASCRSGVISMKPTSAFGVTMLSVSNCVDSIARTSCTSEERVVLAAFCSSATEQLPLAILDSVKQMQTMPALFRNERSVLVGHRASFRRQEIWSRAVLLARRLSESPDPEELKFRDGTPRLRG